MSDVIDRAARAKAIADEASADPVPAASPVLAGAIEKYYAMGQEIAALNSAHEKMIAAKKAAHQQLGAALLRVFEDQNHRAVSTDRVTAYKVLEQHVNISDFAAFAAFVLEQGDLSFVHRRVTKEAAIAYKKQTNTLPPGLSLYEGFAIRARKAPTPSTFSEDFPNE